MTVIDLQAERQAREPHLSGKARCLAYKYEWVAIVPAGTTWLECPSCSLESGRFIGHFEREGAHWRCKCECDLFYATSDGLYCPNCGAWHTF